VNVASRQGDDYNNSISNSSQSKHYDIAFIDHESRWPSVLRVRLLSLQHIARYARVTNTTSGQHNLAKRPHRRRTRTVQSYSPCGVNVHPCNTSFSVPIRVHNPNGILIGTAICVHCAAYRRVSSGIPGMSFPLKIPRSYGATWTPISYIVHWSHPSP